MQNTQHTSKLRTIVLGTVLAGFTLAGCATDGPDRETQDDSVETGEGGTQPDARQEPYATAELTDADDGPVAQVEFYERDAGQTEVIVTAEALDPGFYGFHLHEIGECEPDSAAPDDPEDTGDFMSAGGHLAGEEGADHPMREICRCCWSMMMAQQQWLCGPTALMSLYFWTTTAQRP